ncbi:hypothetical protein Tsubulata_028497, partial [Turnera subulata]
MPCHSFNNNNNNNNNISAVSVSKKLSDPLSATLCFKGYGFTHTQIAKMTEKAPWTLNCRVEYTLKPKLNFLIKIGFVGQLLPELISKDPFILRNSLESHMVRHRLLRPYFDSDEAFVRYALSYTWILSRSFRKALKANLDLLAQEGIPPNSVRLFLSAVPKLITVSPAKFAFLLRTLKGLGFDPLSSKFAYVVNSFPSVGESTWNERAELLKTTFGWSQEDFLTVVRRCPNFLSLSEQNVTNKIEFFKTTLGWSQEDLSIAFRRYPNFISLSEGKLRNKLNFYMNTIKLEPQDFITYPVLLNYSLDTRIRPRWNVLQVLKSNDLVKKGINVKVMLVISNKNMLPDMLTKSQNCWECIQLIRYLVDSCELSLESAVSISKKLKLLRTGLWDPQPAIEYLKAYGFTDTTDCQKASWILKCSVEKVLMPKFDLFVVISFEGRLLLVLIMRDPLILRMSLDLLVDCHHLVRTFCDVNEKFVKCVLRYTWLMYTGYLKRVRVNLEFLAKEGAPLKNGVGKSLWNKKIELLKSFVWSVGEILTASRPYPIFMLSSVEKLRGVKTLFTHSLFLTHSRDKRILPRWNDLQVLKSNTLVKTDIYVVTGVLLRISAKSFLQKYVTNYADKIPDCIQ